MKNVVAYVRVSTDEQVDKYGIDAQKQQIMEFCQDNDMQISEWLIEEGKSGAKEDRPELDKIVYGKDISNPPIEAVVVAKTDRIARDVNIYFYYKHELLRKNITLVSASENFSGYESAFASVLETFVLAMAQMERENIHKRTAGGRKIKADKGGYSGGRAPFGYKVDRLAHKLVVVPKEADIVKTIFRMKDEEHKTYKVICEYLNSIGKTNRSGTKFSISTIQTIYENKKTYQGYYKYGKNAEWVKGDQEAIIDE